MIKKILKQLIYATTIFISTHTLAYKTTFDMHLVSYQPKENTFTVVFPNDGLKTYVDKASLLTRKDFINAEIKINQEFGEVLEVTMTKDALIRLNLAAKLKPEQGLGVFLNHKPLNLFHRFETSKYPVIQMTGLSKFEINLIKQQILQKE